jgi:hypothetical protein
VPTPGYQSSVMAFDEVPKKPADLSWNIFCLVLGLVTVAVFGFALWFDLSYHLMTVIARTARAMSGK